MESGVKKTAGLTRSLVLAIFAGTIGSAFVFGYNIGVINAPEKVMKDWLNDTFFKESYEGSASDAKILNLWALIVSLFPLGALVGGMISGLMAEKLGRNTLLSNNGFCLLGALAMGFSKTVSTFYLLMIGRFLIGINTGISAAICPMYLTEISPVSIRGTLGSMPQLLITIGILVSQILGLSNVLGTETLWPLLLAMISFPSIIQCATLVFCPETPVYLVSKGQVEKAKQALKNLRDTENVEQELEELLEADKKAQEATQVTYTMLFTDKILRWSLTLALMMMAAQQFSGINGIMFYSTILFREGVNMSPESAQGATLGVGAISVLITVVSTAIIDRIGRRALLLLSLGGMGVSCVLLTIFLVLKSASYSFAAYLCVACVIAYVIAFGIGLGGIPWLLVHELFLPNAKAKANSIATPFNWAGAFIIGQLFPPMRAALQDYTFVVFTVLLLFFGLFTYKYVPETKNKTTQEIIEEMKC